jgi:hypothetical protein
MTSPSYKTTFDSNLAVARAMNGSEEDIKNVMRIVGDSAVELSGGYTGEDGLEFQNLIKGWQEFIERIRGGIAGVEEQMGANTTIQSGVQGDISGLISRSKASYDALTPGA